MGFSTTERYNGIKILKKDQIGKKDQTILTLSCPETAHDFDVQ